MRHVRRSTWIWVCLLSLAMAGEAAACPNCKEAIAAQPADVARMAQGFNWSILLMIGVPFSMMSIGAVAVRRAVRLGILPEM